MIQGSNYEMKMKEYVILNRNFSIHTFGLLNVKYIKVKYKPIEFTVCGEISRLGLNFEQNCCNTINHHIMFCTFV